MMFIYHTRSLVALISFIGYSYSRRSTVLTTNHYMFLQFRARLQAVHTAKDLLNGHIYL
jgi:hypothetical protein